MKIELAKRMRMETIYIPCGDIRRDGFAGAVRQGKSGSASGSHLSLGFSARLRADDCGSGIDFFVSLI